MAPSHAPFDVEDVLSKLTEHQKILLLTGRDWWHTHAIEEHGVPSIRMSDGPAGIRGTKFFQGPPAAAIPCGTALAATWDKSLLFQAGELLGNECLAKGAHCWLGPTVNIQRSPLGGRGVEAFGEDPYLTGSLASEMIRGCQSTGVQATIKHFLCNDQENGKSKLNAIVSARALREIHLRPFQIAARDVNPGALMTAYNKLNGHHSSETPLIETILRGEWKWNPLVMSDWFGTYVGHSAINAGLDLEMPGPTIFRGEGLKTALATGDVKQSALAQRARTVLNFVRKASHAPVSETEGQRDCLQDRLLNRELCDSSIVLLQNEGKLLPLPKRMKKLALIGSHMQDLSVLGLGSTSLEPYYTIHPGDAIKSKLGETCDITFEVGAYAHRMLPLLNARLLRDLELVLFNEPPSTTTPTTTRVPIVKMPLVRTYFQLGDYSHPALNFDLFYGVLTAELVPDVSGEWDFGLCCFGTANLYVNDELVIDNSTTQTSGTSFFSEGTREERGAVSVEAGKVYKLRVDFGSAATSKCHPAGGIGLGGGGIRLGACPRIDVEEGIRRAEKAAAAAEYAIICTGLNGDWEGEGHDRATLSLPPHVDTMISRVASACPRTVVVNLSGTPISVPWAHQVPAIVQAWFGGNEAGNGIADVLFGDFNPCGKLPMSWPHDARDNPTYLNFGATQDRCIYGEEVFVGYRYYDKVGRPPKWSFGHGLSYTEFDMRDVDVSMAPSKPDDKTFPPTSVRVQVKNVGQVAGAEVVQVYVGAPDSGMVRPTKELHGFAKVRLQPGEVKEVEIPVDPYAMSYWDEVEESWCLEQGAYQVIVSTTSRAEGEHGRSPLTGWLEVPGTKHWLGL
ncbi:hypothetical protein PV10_06392 [Exophiala mesophila]|uniref:Probable beta-glucosidase H n=1 Tax=Exophiala mesophila TaxID=212818 RepID=A0A0D1ZB40_EXOME|nr:uncharacterized protein PV10_06392 [Exophiala mesophila]KIV91902.1 hypothetical protein PV10_06392 [Exophiala mesophila]